MEIQATKIFTASHLKQQRIELGWFREPRASLVIYLPRLPRLLSQTPSVTRPFSVFNSPQGIYFFGDLTDCLDQLSFDMASF